MAADSVTLEDVHAALRKRWGAGYTSVLSERTRRGRKVYTAIWDSSKPVGHIAHSAPSLRELKERIENGV